MCLAPEQRLDAQVRSAELLAQLVESAKVSGWNVVQVQSLSEATECVVALTIDLGAKSLVHSTHEVMGHMRLSERLANTKVTVIPIGLGRSMEQVARMEVRKDSINAHIGITGVDFAIAETGSCVLIVRPGIGRLVSLLPPVHVAVVCRGQVLSSLDEIFTLRRSAHLRGEGEGHMNIITGPSRSADIEQMLIKGVHGPREVYMVLVG